MALWLEQPVPVRGGDNLSPASRPVLASLPLPHPSLRYHKRCQLHVSPKLRLHPKVPIAHGIARDLLQTRMLPLLAPSQ